MTRGGKLRILCTPLYVEGREGRKTVGKSNGVQEERRIEDGHLRQDHP